MIRKSTLVLSLLLVSFLGLFFLAKPALAGDCSTKTEATYILSEDYKGLQGCTNWHYYLKETSWRSQKVNGRWIIAPVTQISQAKFENGFQQLKSWYGEAVNGPYWSKPGAYDWVMLSQKHSVGGDNQTPIVYWRAPIKGSAKITITDQKIDFLYGRSKGNGYKFGIGYTNSIGQWATPVKELSTNGGDKTLKTLTYTKQMNGNDTLFYFKDSLNSPYGDGARYSAKIEFTPSAPLIDTITVQTCASTSCSGYSTALINGQNFGPDIAIEVIGNLDGIHYATKQNVRLTGRTGTTQLIVDFDSLPCQTYKLRLFYQDSKVPTLTRDMGHLGSFSCPRG